MHLLNAAHRLALRSALASLGSFVAMALLTGIALAAPPPNDNFSSPVVINPAALPFSATVLVNEATPEGGESFPCTFSTQTVWYRFAPSSDTWIAVSGSGPVGAIAVYRDPAGSIFSLGFLTCFTFGGQSLFLAHAGTTY